MASASRLSHTASSSSIFSATVSLATSPNKSLTGLIGTVPLRTGGSQTPPHRRASGSQSPRAAAPSYCIEKKASRGCAELAERAPQAGEVLGRAFRWLQLRRGAGQEVATGEEADDLLVGA